MQDSLDCTEGFAQGNTWFPGKAAWSPLQQPWQSVTLGLKEVLHKNARNTREPMTTSENNAPIQSQGLEQPLGGRSWERVGIREMGKEVIA